MGKAQKIAEEKEQIRLSKLDEVIERINFRFATSKKADNHQGYFECGSRFGSHGNQNPFAFGDKMIEVFETDEGWYWWTTDTNMWCIGPYPTVHMAEDHADSFLTYGVN